MSRTIPSLLRFSPPLQKFFQLSLNLLEYRSLFSCARECNWPAQNKARHAWEAGKLTSSLNMLHDGNFPSHSSHAFRQVITARAR